MSSVLVAIQWSDKSLFVCIVRGRRRTVDVQQRRPPPSFTHSFADRVMKTIMQVKWRKNVKNVPRGEGARGHGGENKHEEIDKTEAFLTK